MILAAAAALCAPVQVHDGDSFRCGSERVRIANIDAPEVAGSPKCQAPRRDGWCDYRLGEAARRALAALFAQGPVMVARIRPDAYGRTLARVSVNGIDAGEWLVSQGLARPWR